MITRVAENNTSVQLLLIDAETYQFVYSKLTRQIEEAFTVRKNFDKTYYNPVQLDMIDTKYLVMAYKQIKNYLDKKNANTGNNR